MANTKISSHILHDNAVTSAHIANGAIHANSLSNITSAHVAEGSNLYFTNARARSSISVTGGNLAYDNTTGVLQLTDSEIRDALSAGTGVSYSSGQFSIGQAVGTSDTVSFGNITTAGYLRGPSNFTIDPAAYGDDTGTLIIAGNLQVDGTTTTINSTTLTVDDKNITLASGSANASAASGAGFTVDIGSGTNPSITYDGTNDEWDFNKPLNVTGTGKFSGDVGVGATPTARLDVRRGDASGKIAEFHQNAGYGIDIGSSQAVAYISSGYNQRLDFKTDPTSGQTERMSILANGKVGIGTTAPAQKLHVQNASGTTFVRTEVAAGSLVGFNIKKTGSTNQEWNIVDGASVNGRLQIQDVTDNRIDMTFDGTGNVGIGTTTPAGKLHVYSGDAGTVTPSSQADDLVVEASTEGGITIMTPDSQSARIRFTSPSTESGDEGGADIFYRQNINKMSIGTTVSGGQLAFKSGAGVQGITLDASGIATFAGNILVTKTSSWAEMHLDGAAGGDLIFKDNGVSYGEIYAGSGHGMVLKSYTNQDMHFLTNANATAKMVIKSDGQLLINKTASDVGASTNIVEADGNFRLSGGNYGIKFNNGAHEILGIQQIANHKMQLGSQKVTIDVANGRLGIGTASPDYTLEVVGNSMIGDASAVTSPAFAAQQEIVKSFSYGSTGAGRGGNLYLLNTNTNGDAGLVTFGGYSNHTGNLYYQTGAIGGGTEAQDGGSWGGYLSFITTSDGSKGAASGMYEQMRITADGHVQIKQTGSAPTNGVMMPGHIEFKGQGWDSNSGSDDMNAKIEMAATYGKVGSGATSPELVFSLQGAGGLDASSESYVEGMRLVGAGAYNNNQPRLGIGTGSPTKALDVYTSTNTGGIQITGGTGATNTSLHISNAGSSGNNWNISSTGGGHGYGDGQLHFGVAYGVPKMRITGSGNVGIGHATGGHVPQKVLEVECPSNDVVTLGARTLSVNNWAGIHFGYKENSTVYRKSAIVFERTDLDSNNAQGKVHIFNGPQAGAGSATLADRAFTINEDGSVELGRPNTLLTEDSYSLQNHQILFKPQQSGGDEAIEEKSACFSKIWRKSAVLHPGQYSNGNYYVGMGVNSADTVSYIVYKMNVVKCKQIYARAFTANSADGQTRTNVIYYSTDDTNWSTLATGTWAAGGNTREAALDTSTMAGSIGGFFTGTIFIKCAIEGGATGHTNLVGWNEFEFKARAQSMDLEGGGFGLSKNDLTLAGIANTGHGYAPLSQAYGHQYSGTNQTAIISANSGTQTFASKGFGHAELAIFQPCTVASIGANGLQVMADGIMHMSFNQDIITAGDTSYCSLQVRRYNEGMNAGVVVGSTLIKNTNGHWDMLVGNFVFDVRAGDVITCTITGGSILSLDGGTWSNYNFMLFPSATTSQGNAGSTHLPWLKN